MHFGYMPHANAVHRGQHRAVSLIKRHERGMEGGRYRGMMGTKLASAGGVSAFNARGWRACFPLCWLSRIAQFPATADRHGLRKTFHFLDPAGCVRCFWAPTSFLRLCQNIDRLHRPNARHRFPGSITRRQPFALTLRTVMFRFVQPRGSEII